MSSEPVATIRAYLEDPSDPSVIDPAELRAVLADVERLRADLARAERAALDMLAQPPGLLPGQTKLDAALVVIGSMLDNKHAQLVDVADKLRKERADLAATRAALEALVAAVQEYDQDREFTSLWRAADRADATLTPRPGGVKVSGAWTEPRQAGTEAGMDLVEEVALAMRSSDDAFANIQNEPGAAYPVMARAAIPIVERDVARRMLGPAAVEAFAKAYGITGYDALIATGLRAAVSAALGAGVEAEEVATRPSLTAEQVHQVASFVLGALPQLDGVEVGELRSVVTDALEQVRPAVVVRPLSAAAATRPAIDAAVTDEDVDACIKAYRESPWARAEPDWMRAALSAFVARRAPAVAPGPCGERIDGVSGPLFCHLLHGHAGWHVDDCGASWGPNHWKPAPAVAVAPIAVGRWAMGERLFSRVIGATKWMDLTSEARHAWADHAESLAREVAEAAFAACREHLQAADGNNVIGWDDARSALRVAPPVEVEALQKQFADIAAALEHNRGPAVPLVDWAKRTRDERNAAFGDAHIAESEARELRRALANEKATREKAEHRASMAEIGIANVQAICTAAGISEAMAAWDRVRRLVSERDALAARLEQERRGVVAFAAASGSLAGILTNYLDSCSEDDSRHWLVDARKSLDRYAEALSALAPAPDAPAAPPAGGEPKPWPREPSFGQASATVRWCGEVEARVDDLTRQVDLLRRESARGGGL